jgi:hypothetical protein
MLKLEKYVEEINEKCILCNKTLKSILIKNSHILANIFLNNYSKLINDQISTQNKDPSKRKLLKFNSYTYKTHRDRAVGEASTRANACIGYL